MAEQITPTTSGQKTAQKSPGNKIQATSGRAGRARGFVLTIWRDRDGADECLQKLKDWDPLYMCWAPETCPETNRPHYQVYVYWSSQKAFKTMGGLVKNGLGWNKKAEGTARQNREYIYGPYDGPDGKHKDANPEAQELGDMPMQGARHDLHTVGRAIRAGTRIRDLFEQEEHWGPLAQYEKFYKKLQFHTDRKTAIQQYRDGIKPFVTVLWGKSGCGKTRRPWEIHGAENVYEVPYTRPEAGHLVVVGVQFFYARVNVRSRATALRAQELIS